LFVEQVSATRKYVSMNAETEQVFRMFAAGVAGETVRPVVLEEGKEDSEIGIGLFVNHDCKFVIPIKFVNGTNDYRKLARDLQDIVTEAILLWAERIDQAQKFNAQMDKAAEAVGANNGNL
jgi:hypothetical protein